MTISNRLRNNLIAIALVIAWMTAVLLLGGCSLFGGQGLRVEYQDQTGKLVKIDTDYQVENGFTMERDGEGYTIELGSATTNTADQAGILAVMAQLLSMIQATYIPASAPTPAD